MNKASNAELTTAPCLGPHSTDYEGHRCCKTANDQKHAYKSAKSKIGPTKI